ncbi:MAG: hypothetical protein IKA17_05400 [Clostridia bacterium]|nr:hypothetical protein [Clostridia bacterium]
MNYIKKPYLPKRKAKLFISDVPIDGSITIRSAAISCMPKSMKHHADLGICIISEKKAVCPEETLEYYKSALREYGIDIIKGKSKLKGNYPHDCAYNVGVAGKWFFANEKVIDRELHNCLCENGYEFIPVKQGYAKCSMCAIDENSLITSDTGIFRACEKKGIDALLVSNDDIKLEGFENGFFGGCCGFDGENLLVNGNAKTLKDYKSIEKFLTERGFGIISLNSGAIVDIGSIIPLMTT